MRWGPGILTAFLSAVGLLLGPHAGRAQAPPPPPEVAVPVYPADPLRQGQPADLTLENFFTAGWCAPFTERPATGGAERILLFRTQTPFLDRAALLNYQLGLHEGPDRVNESQLGGELLLPVNARVMFDVKAAYDFNGDGLPDTGGAAGSITGVLQLIDTPTSALNVRLGFEVPGATTCWSTGCSLAWVWPACRTWAGASPCRAASPSISRWEAPNSAPTWR
jgi:hypothetical protein